MSEKNTSMPAAIRGGLLGENPLLRLGLGLCPALAVTTRAGSALGMGIATACALIGANAVVALIRGLLPEKGRLPVFVMVSALFATLARMVIRGWFPALAASLGVYLPLIAVNCLLLYRAESFAAENGIGAACADGVGMGLGYVCAMLAIGILREVLGHGSCFGAALPAAFEPMVLLALPAGGFMVLGIAMGVYNAIIHKNDGKGA